VNVPLDGAPDEELADWLTTAHSLISAKLTKRAKLELGLA
jgi:predicted DNA-binding protein (MmcQ/YjbR family)